MTTESSLSIAQRIKTQMLRRRITDAELARQIGVPQGTISRILSGETRDPRISTLQAIARVLQTSIDSLVSDELSAIPVLDWPEIAAFVRGDIDHARLKDWITVSKIAARGSFAARTTPSMEPRYRNGSTIIVEPREDYRDFQVVIVSIARGEPAIRRLIRDGADLYLKRLDATAATPAAPISADTQMIGVVIEARMPE